MLFAGYRQVSNFSDTERVVPSPWATLEKTGGLDAFLLVLNAHTRRQASHPADGIV